VGTIVPGRELERFVDKLSDKYGIILMRDAEERDKCFVYMKETHHEPEITMPGPNCIKDDFHRYDEAVNASMSKCLKEKNQQMGETRMHWWIMRTKFDVPKYGQKCKSFKEFY